MEALLPLHIALMSIAIMLVIAAALIAKGRKKNWLKTHKKFALAGVVISILGAACIASQKIAHHYHHFRTPHALAGLVTLCFLLITPLIGASIAKKPHLLRPIHRAFGRITSGILLLTGCMGVYQFIQLNKE